MSSRRFSLSNVQESTLSKQQESTDWSKCIICQKDNADDSLICPNKKSDGAGYKPLVENLIKFKELDCLPFNLDRLDDGDGIENTLKQNNACVHKLCKLEYGKSRLQRAEKRKSVESGYSDGAQKSSKYTRQSRSSTAGSKTNCFFCDEDDSSEPLHEACTFGMDAHVRKCAIELNDKQMLAKLSAGDLMAQEAKYHSRCLVNLYNKTRPSRSDQEDTQSENIGHGIALAELIMYINESRTTDDVATVFKLRDLADIYHKKIEQFGLSVTSRVNTTRLKERILAHIPDLEAHREGRDTYLVFNKDIGPAIRKAFEEDADDEGIHLVKAASVVRRHMLSMSNKFTGTFEEGCQEAAVPESLLALVNMILDGPNIKADPKLAPQSALTIAQLLQFNCHARRRKDSSGTRHIMSNETPLPIYLGLEIHAQTRKRQLVDTFFFNLDCVSPMIEYYQYLLILGIVSAISIGLKM